VLLDFEVVLLLVEVFFFVEVLDFEVVAALVVVVSLSNLGGLHLLHGVYLPDAASRVVSIQLLLSDEQPEL